MKRALYKPLGFLFLALALLGIVLPVLPGTPFALLSAWFFARSSEKWHRRLLHSKLFGPTLRGWETDRCIPCRVKQVAIIMMLTAGGASLVFAVSDPGLKIATGVLMAIGTTTILMIRTCREPVA